jgi:hypothetical protein
MKGIGLQSPIFFHIDIETQRRKDAKPGATALKISRSINNFKRY